MTEFDLIQRYFTEQQAVLAASTESIASVDKGIGDDAAVIDIKSACRWVTCVDTLVQGRHFSDDWQQVETLAFAIGFKAAAVNASDLAAMGAAPHSLLLALALPERLANETWLAAFAKGLSHACQQFGMALIGGDTTRADKLVISVTANGVIDKQLCPIYRHGAQVGDKVYVSGTLGDASYALHHLATDIGKQLSHRLHMPTPRLGLGQALVRQGNATAMIDVSDGLVQDLAHICTQSAVSIRLDLDKLPTSEPLQSIDLEARLRCQLTGGDDYELVFTLPADVTPPKTAITNIKVTCIGDVVGIATHSTEKGKLVQLHYQGQLVDRNNAYPFTEFPDLAGFQHF